MSEENSLSTTPVNVAIKALQTQVDQLKRIINKDDTPSASGNNVNEQDLKDQIKALTITNEKAEYRIKFLLRALEKRETK